MKISTFMISSLLTGMLFASPVSAGPIAAADAGGVIGGAEVGCGFGPWGCLAGAIVGGAGMSLATAWSRVPPDIGGKPAISIWNPTGGNCGDIFLPGTFGCRKPPSPPFGDILFSRQSTMSEVGYWHNRIVRAYMAEHKGFDSAALERVAIRELGLEREIIKDPKLKQLISAAATGKFDRSPFAWEASMKKEADSIMDGSQSFQKKGQLMADIERKYLQQYGRDLTSQSAIQGYFSVYKFSEAYWRNAQSLAEGNCLIEPSRCGLR